ncbi:MAG: hypothetical protein V4489_03590, partial [Chlamydiota bacterium]
GPGSLSAAIDTVNATPSAGPIKIESGITPTLSAPYPTIEVSMTIESNGMTTTVKVLSKVPIQDFTFLH